jgi:hypothetical protein
MKTHPIANLVPEQTTEEYERLRDSVKRGYDSLRPIVTLDGMILDGRHRYKACKAEGIDPCTQEWEPSFEGDSPELFVLRSTFHRSMFTQPAGRARRLHHGAD